jgi:hypothetical protein
VVRDAGSTDAGLNDGGAATGPLGSWRVEAVTGTQCAQGAPAGLGYNPGGSEDLVVFVQGGGACWNNGTCANNYCHGTGRGEREQRRTGGRPNARHRAQRPLAGGERPTRLHTVLFPHRLEFAGEGRREIGLREAVLQELTSRRDPEDHWCRDHSACDGQQDKEPQSQANPECGVRLSLALRDHVLDGCFAGAGLH